MAITGTDRGTGTNNSATQSWTVTPGGNMAQNSWAVLCIAADNGSSGGATNDFGVVTDTIGNTWQLMQAPLFDNGSASAGVQGAIYVSTMHAGAVGTGTTITVRTATNATAKTWALHEIVPTSSAYKLNFVKGANGTGATGTAASITTGSIASGNIVIAASFDEYGTAQTPTGANDTTNGTWSTMLTTEIGTTAAGMSIISQRKVVSGTGTQLFNAVWGTSSDYIDAWIELTEVAKTTAVRDMLRSGLIPSTRTQ